jgi:hypothetical protein
MSVFMTLSENFQLLSYDEELFLDAIQQRIGAEQLDEYRAPILDQARGETTLYINRIFDYRQTWCWSADIYQIKDEDLSESAWLVGFGRGYVYWGSLTRSTYVRAVRSRQ